MSENWKMVQLRTKPEDCKYIGTCSFYGADRCNDMQWKDASDCIIYQLIESVQELKDKLN